MSDDVRIVEVPHGGLAPPLQTQVDAIFFEASARSFASAAERVAFRRRWLGCYLEGGTDVLLVALHSAGAVAGYLVGALGDPAAQARFADLDYLRGPFRDLCRRYPAHLHINLAPAFRNRGLGPRLIAAFAARAAAAGSAGMHVVTARSARNIRFYERCGFAEQGNARWQERDLVFLAQSLAQSLAKTLRGAEKN